MIICLGTLTGVGSRSREGANVLSAGKARIRKIIDNHIHVWRSTPVFAPLAEVLENNGKDIFERLLRLSAFTTKENFGDSVRDFLVRYAMERVDAGINATHFTLFKEAETVQVILEDCFGVTLGIDEDKPVVPYQGRALKIIIGCLCHCRPRGADRSKDIAAFMQLFSRLKPELKPDQDRIMRYKSMVWLIYLAIAVITREKTARDGRQGFFSRRFRELFEHAVKGDIIDEDSRRPGYDGGKWENTLFGWLQGEDRRPFLLKLERQFNFENRSEHANRCLLAEHRKSIFDQALSLFSAN